MNLGPCPHVYASHLFLLTIVTLKTHLYPVGLSPSHVLQLRTVGVQRYLSACRHRMCCNCVPSAYNATSPRVMQCTEYTAPESSANISSDRANRK